MSIEPEATLPALTLTAIADAYGLGEVFDTSFVARGAMGSVNRVGTMMRDEQRHWTVKRSFWNQYSEHVIAREVEFTARCVSIGVAAPRSVQRVDGGGYVLTADDQSDRESQYRVLEWVEGKVGRSDDQSTIPPIAEWMARIHNLAFDPAGHSIDPWFVQVTYDWDDLAGRLASRAPDVAEQLQTHQSEIKELTNLVNTTANPVPYGVMPTSAPTIWCGETPDLS